MMAEWHDVVPVNRVNLGLLLDQHLSHLQGGDASVDGQAVMQRDTV